MRPMPGMVGLVPSGSKVNFFFLKGTRYICTLHLLLCQILHALSVFILYITYSCTFVG